MAVDHRCVNERSIFVLRTRCELQRLLNASNFCPVLIKPGVHLELVCDDPTGNGASTTSFEKNTFNALKSKIPTQPCCYDASSTERISATSASLFSQHVAAPSCRTALFWKPMSASLKNACVKNSAVSVVRTCGLRLLLTVTTDYVSSAWDIDPEQLRLADSVLARVLVELADRYPIVEPRVAFVYYGMERNTEEVRCKEERREQNDGITETRFALQTTPLSLTHLATEDATRLVLKEEWLPSIQLQSVIERTLMFLRVQTLAHLRARKVSSSLDVVKNAADNRIAADLSWISLRRVLFISFVVRIVAGYLPHSGQMNAPYYGDYEAQRRWKRLTVHRPLQSWYAQDEALWTLDYPPLTAYHEMLMGLINHWFYPESIALNSDGYFSLKHKLFMRGSVLVSEMMLLYSAAVVFWLYLPDHLLLQARRRSLDAYTINRAQRLFCLLLFLTCPPLVFVDHVHFQYNSVAFGLLLWSVNCFALNRPCFGAICAAAAMLYKQTFLYFSPAIAFYLLGISSHTQTQIGWLMAPILQRRPTREGLVRLSRPVFAALGFAFAVVFPFLYAGIPEAQKPMYSSSTLLTIFQPLVFILKRIFPFHRGIYEDYVANVWVALSPVIKVNAIAKRSLYAQSVVLRCCTLATALAFIPSCVLVFQKPSFGRFQLALVASSLAFYLFSAQVHEKAILLPTISLMLLLPRLYWFAVFFCLTASFSLFHLMSKDWALPAFLGFTVIWATVALTASPFHPSLIITKPRNEPPVRTTTTDRTVPETLDNTPHKSFSCWTPSLGLCCFPRAVLWWHRATSRQLDISFWDLKALHAAVILGAITLGVLQICVPCPARYPYLHIYFQSTYCCGIFLISWATMVKEQYVALGAKTCADFPGVPITRKVLLCGHTISDDVSEEKKKHQ